MRRKELSIMLGVVVALGVLVWGFSFGGFSAGTPILPNGGNNSNNGTPTNTLTYSINYTGHISLETGSVKIGDFEEPYILGETVKSYINMHNGTSDNVTLYFSCRPPDNPWPGYVSAPTGTCAWFWPESYNITLEPLTGRYIEIYIMIPVSTPESDFTVYYLTGEGRSYLNDAREQTTASEDAMAAAFKEVLVSFPDIYSQFDDLYANRGDKYVFKAIYDAFPEHYPELVGAWEEARLNAEMDLSAIPYADALVTVERLGSITETNRNNYPELMGVPEQYIAKADLRVQPWEVWITSSEGVTCETCGNVFTELACRYIITMRQSS